MTEYQQVSALLTEYESLFLTDPFQALKNMVDLYPRADRAMNHEVADAIELWVTDQIDRQLVVYLQEKMDINNKFSNTYASWISFFKGK